MYAFTFKIEYLSYLSLFLDLGKSTFQIALHSRDNRKALLSLKNNQQIMIIYTVLFKFEYFFEKNDLKFLDSKS